MKIGDVSIKLGMPASTIRYYEKIGLIERQPRVSGRRDFGDQAMFALQFVRLAQETGFSISETRALLDAYAKDKSRNGAWRTMAKDKRDDVRAQIKKLEQMDRVLGELLSCSCSSLAECVEKGLIRNHGAQNGR